MSPAPRRTRLVLKILVAGLLIAALAYLLHPGSGYFDLTINGRHFEGPFGAVAALPMAIGILLLCGLLTLLIVFGVGVLFLWIFGLAAVGAIVMAAPFMLPVLVLLLVVYLIARV